MSLRDTTGLDRSEALWSVERDLADAGCSVLEIVAIVMGSPLDKYLGRGDHLRRLTVEASRAVADRGVDPLEGGALPEGTPLWASDLASVHIPRPRWLVEGIWIRGGCGFISGAPKSYKSWLAIDLAVSVASGSPLLGEHRVVATGPVLYLQEEDSLATAVDRLDQVVEGRAPSAHWGGVMGIEEGLVTWEPGSGLPIDIQAHTGIVLSDPRWHAWLAERVRTYGYRAVIIDTLTTTVGDVDLDKAVELQTRVLRPLRELAQTYDCSVVIVHHSRKNTGGSRRGSNMLGSVALHGWVDCALYLDRDEESGEITVSPEGKHDPSSGWVMTVPRMYRDWHTCGRQVWAPEVVAGESTPEPPRRQAGSKICKILRGMGGSAPAEELQAVAGRGWRRQIDAAIERGTVVEREAGVFTVAGAK
jgi:gp088